jgi:hypothetical protein
MPASFATVTPGNPSSEAYARLMHGSTLADAARLTPEEEQRCQAEFSRVWERLLHNAEVTKWLAPGQDLGWRGGTPRRSLRASGGRTTDLIQLIPWALREKLSGDVIYEDTAQREEQVTSGRALEPGDAASIRFRSLNPATADGQPLPPGREPEVERFLDLQVMLAAYTAAPYFVPAAEAFDAATGLPPEPGAQLRLTAEAVVFHDGVPLPAVIADDDALHAHAAAHFDTVHDTLFDGSPLVMGGVVLAHPDDNTDQALQFDPLVGWLIIANRMHDGRYAWAMHPVYRLDTNSGPAARVLRNYAALNALEGWDTPPRVPGQARPSGKSKKKPRLTAAERRRQQLEQAARTPQARAGALLGVRVLSFTAPPHQAALPPQASGSTRAPAQYRDWRRAHWTRNTRVHLLDDQGRPSGPVYGPDAVEDVTFTRRRTRVRGTWVNEHLPERPGQTPVYAVDQRLTRTSGDSA